MQSVFPCRLNSKTFNFVLSKYRQEKLKSSRWDWFKVEVVQVTWIITPDSFPPFNALKTFLLIPQLIQYINYILLICYICSVRCGESTHDGSRFIFTIRKQKENSQDFYFRTIHLWSFLHWDAAILRCSERSL